jgi:hypothetical protein
VKRLKKIVLSIVLAFAMVFTLNVTPAQATNRWKSAVCATGRSGAQNDMVFNVYYTIYSSASGQRASMSLDSGHTKVTHPYAAGTDYDFSFVSNSGVAWGTGHQTSGASTVDIYPPSAANGLTQYNPRASLYAGANGDGYNMCHVDVYLTP